MGTDYKLKSVLSLQNSSTGEIAMVFSLKHVFVSGSTCTNAYFCQQKFTLTCMYSVLILSAISPFTTGLKVLFGPGDCTSTVHFSSY